MNYATRQRTAVQKALDEAQRPLTPAEILEAARAISPGLGIATVYRVLRILTEMDAINIVEIPGAPPHYELKQARPHYHFLCEVCDKVYAVEGSVPNVEQLAPSGFTVKHHALALYGICANPSCSSGTPTR